jgi:hypothetical protein
MPPPGCPCAWVGGVAEATLVPEPLECVSHPLLPALLCPGAGCSPPAAAAAAPPVPLVPAAVDSLGCPPPTMMVLVPPMLLAAAAGPIVGNTSDRGAPTGVAAGCARMDWFHLSL